MNLISLMPTPNLRIDIVRKVLFQMEVLGDVVTDKDVQLAVAYAQIEANQVWLSRVKIPLCVTL